eukprot:UN00090
MSKFSIFKLLLQSFQMPPVCKRRSLGSFSPSGRLTK